MYMKGRYITGGGAESCKKERLGVTHVAVVALTPLTTLPQTQAEFVRSPVRGQEQEQPGVVPS